MLKKSLCQASFSVRAMQILSWLQNSGPTLYPRKSAGAKLGYVFCGSRRGLQWALQQDGTLRLCSHPVLREARGLKLITHIAQTCKLSNTPPLMLKWMKYQQLADWVK